MPVLSEHVGTDVLAELNDEGNHINVQFPYDAADVKRVKRVPGARFQPPSKGGPYWYLPVDLVSARMLRDEFGARLKLGPKVVKWGQEQNKKENTLRSLSSADDADLPNMKKINADLFKWMRPYQRAGTAMMAANSIICADQPGLGKTAETIGAIMEMGEDHYNGPHLIVAPKTSLEVVWETELERWSDHPYIIMSGDDSPEERQELIDLAVEFVEDEQPFFMVLNPAFVRYIKDPDAPPVMVRGKKVPAKKPAYPQLFEIAWNTIVFDEYHKMGLSNSKTSMFEAANDLKGEHKLLLSGTPMGGKPIKLWGALHFLDPAKFSAKWRWVDQWLETSDNGYGKIIEGLRPGREKAFFEALEPYMVRRTKAEVLKDLPAKQYVDIDVEMTTTQKKQYLQFAADAEVKIEEENLSATGVLAEYMRLKQFAGARQKVRQLGNGELKVLPTTDSGKLPHVMRLLEERGIVSAKEAEAGEGTAIQDSDEQVVIASQFSSMADMIYEYLTEQGIPCGKITGDVSQAHRTELTQNFQAGKFRVMVMSTTAGGVAITLDKASTVIIMDETWDPDDQEQLEDRVHRASRIHQVTVYYLRSKETIEQYIQELVLNKAGINKEILDLRRQGLKAIR